MNDNSKNVGTPTNALRTLLGRVLGGRFVAGDDGFITLASGQRIRKDKVVTQIAERSVSRVRQDINKWVKARQWAESKIQPRRNDLLTCYDDVALDNHLSGLIEHTILERLFAEPFKVVNAAGEEIPEATAYFEDQWFLDFIRYAIESIFWGHSLIQFDYPVRHADGTLTYTGVELVNRRHVRPETGKVVINEWDTDEDKKAIDFRNDPAYGQLLIEVGGKTTLGLFLKAAPQTIFKKNAESAWSEYAEIFGAPFRWATTPSKNKADQQAIGDTLKQLGFAAYGVFPNDVEIKFLETVKGDAYEVYNNLMSFANLELSKLLVGVTMMNDNGSSKSQGEVHERATELVIETLKRFIKYLIKGKLMPMMVSHGFKLQGAKWLYDEEKDLDELFTKVIGLLKYYDIEMEWITETFGIPIISAKAQPGAGTDMDDKDEEDAPGKKPPKGEKKKR